MSEQVIKNTQRTTIWVSSAQTSTVRPLVITNVLILYKGILVYDFPTKTVYLFFWPNIKLILFHLTKKVYTCDYLQNVQLYINE